MEKRLEKMKEEITKSNRFYEGLAVIGIAAETASASGRLTAHYQDANMANFLQGFILGLVIVMEVLAISKMAKNRAALKDDMKLKRLYNEMHDERVVQIEAMAGRTGIKAAMLLTLVAAFIVSYFSMEAFLAMVGVIILSGVVMKVCRLYYGKTYTGKE